MNRLRAAMAIRWQVTIALALALMLVLGLAGAGVYLQLQSELDQAIDRGLRARAIDIEASQRLRPQLAGVSDGGLETDESPAQIIDETGRILASSVREPLPLITAAQLRAARTRPILVDRPGDAVLDESLRIRAAPISLAGRRYVLLVGDSLDERGETLSAMLTVGSIGLVVALLAATSAGYLVIGMALRPVERMRAQAEAVAAIPDRRPAIPRTGDELARLGATLNAMLDRIERARRAEHDLLERERRFIADASHELRTPLTVLKSELEVALIDPSDAGELRAALESAVQETDRVCALAEDLLTLAKAENRAPVRRSVELAGVLAAAADRQRGRAARLGRRIVIGCPQGLRADVDPELLDRALTNLLDNAVRHGQGTISCTAARSDGTVVLGVLDEGAGIPGELETVAFQRFTRGSPGRRGPGTGLGLAIVAAVAEAHDGVASSHRGPDGAGVQLTLPA